MRASRRRLANAYGVHRIIIPVFGSNVLWGGGTAGGNGGGTAGKRQGNGGGTAGKRQGNGGGTAGATGAERAKRGVGGRRWRRLTGLACRGRSYERCTRAYESLREIGQKKLVVQYVSWRGPRLEQGLMDFTSENGVFEMTDCGGERAPGSNGAGTGSSWPSSCGSWRRAMEGRPGLFSQRRSTFGFSVT